MALKILKYTVAPHHKAFLGRGGYSIVYRATEKGSDIPVALKKSRVSKTVKRPILRHEVRLLQLLKGHPAIPAVYGYGHLEHFEYISMELLGPSVAEKQKDGAGVMVETVVRIVDQALAALQHIHTSGVVHRDIKPENLLCALDDPTTIKLVDFGISKKFSRNKQDWIKYDPFNDRRNIVGSLYWASLNSHNGEDLAPRDDLESLALVALFLLRGSLPWKPRPRLESPLRSQEIIRIMKSACSGPDLSVDFPAEFGELLTYSRSMICHQLPEYKTLRASFGGLASRMSYSNNNGPLDWTPCYPPSANLVLDEPTVLISDDKDEGEDDDGDDLGDNSYFNFDIDMWNCQGERDKDLTFPAGEEAEHDSVIPVIGEVEQTSSTY